MKSLSPTGTENFYISLFERNPSVMLIFERETYKILDVNRAALETYGYSKEEFLSMTIKDLRLREDWDKIKTAGKILLDDLKTGVWKHVKKTGELITVEIRAVIINYMGREAVLSIPRDITERIKKEEEISSLNKSLLEANENLRQNVTITTQLNEELKLKDERLKAAQEVGKIGYWEYNISNGLYFCSEELFHIFELPVERGAVERDLFTSSIHPDDLQMVRSANERAVKLGGPLDYSYRIITKKGEVKYIYTKGETKYDERRKAKIIFGISMDITAEKKNKEEILRNANNIDIILKSIVDPFFIVDKDYNFIFVNDALMNLTGYSKEYLIGKIMWPVFMNSDFTDIRRALEKSLKQNISAEFEFSFKQKTFQCHIYPSKIGFAVSCTDISSRKKMDTELKEKVRFIQEVSDNSPGAVYQAAFYTDGTRKITFASEHFEQISGIPVSEVLLDSQKVYEAVHPEDMDKVKDALEKAVKTGLKLNIKYRMINQKTKDIKWVRNSSIPRKMSDGAIVLTGVVVDITESENFYAELEKSNQRYEYISKATNEAIWEVEMGIDNPIVKFSGAYKNIFGNEYESEIPYEEWKSLLHPDDIYEIMKLSNKVADEKHGNYWEAEYRLIRRDGKVLNILEKAYLIYDKTGKIPIRTIGTMQDITHIKKIQAEKEKMVMDLIKRNEALEKFTYMVSHNIRAPLANVMGLSMLLEDESMDAEARGELNKMILTSSHRLDEVVKDINDILDSNKKFNEDRTEVIFENLLDEIKSIEKYGIKKAGMKIIYDFKEAKSIFGIRSSVQSIFRNLISNSIKFKNDKNPQIKITSSQDAQFIYLTFEDNGIGFDSIKNSEKIFGLYNRFHLEKEGKGIGLYMVKTQVENLGGEIFAESEVNKGTKFLLKFRKSHL